MEDRNLVLSPDQKSNQAAQKTSAGGVAKSKRMRIAWLCPYRLGLLQPELAISKRLRWHPASWIVNLARAISKIDNVDLHIITATAGIARNQVIRKDGLTFHVVRNTIPFTMRGFPGYLPLDVITKYANLRRQVRKVILALQPDLIHVHGTEDGYGLAALDVGLPTVVSLQGIIQLYAPVSPSLFFRLQTPIESRIIRKCKYFGSRTEWANALIRTLNSNAIIYDLTEAIDPVFFEERVRRPTRNILLVGSVEQRKGIEEALDAMSLIVAKCPSAKLLVVGDGNPDYLEKLKHRTMSADTGPNIEWLGFKTPEEIRALHARSAVLIHPCRIDNSPNSVAEAMASGLPVVASNVGGVPSMIDHGVSGILVEPRNHRQLAEAVISLLQNEAERTRLANRAKEVALERHLPSRVAEKTVRVYEDIISRETKR